MPYCTKNMKSDSQLLFIQIKSFLSNVADGELNWTGLEGSPGEYVNPTKLGPQSQKDFLDFKNPQLVIIVGMSY